MTSGSVIVVGELLADVVAPPLGRQRPGDPSGSILMTARPGGSPANVAVGLARLGVTVRFAGRISSSGLGPWLGGNLEANGVDLSLSVTAREHPTIALVTLDEAGTASYSFYGPDTADWQWRHDELPDVAGDASAVHAGSLACVLEPGASVLAGWLDELRRRNVTLVAFDPNVRLGLIKRLDAVRAVIEQRVAASHLVKASEEDVQALYPGHRPLEVARQWAVSGPELVVVTLAERGSAAVRPDGSIQTRQGDPIRVADTIGAGDAFESALLAWLAEAAALCPGGPAALDDAEIAAALDTANAAAAIACGRAGVDPPRRREMAGARWPRRPAAPGPSAPGPPARG